jgi:hypothetical protein
MVWIRSRTVLVSWYKTFKGSTTEELVGKLDKLEADDNQIEAAAKIVREAVLSGEFGGGPYNVAISGHARQSDVDTSGTTLSVTIHSRS